MWALIKNNSWFYIIYFIALIISCFFILTTEKLQLHQQINQCVGNSITDNFFKYFTHLGDGLFLIIVSLLICFFDVKISANWTFFMKSKPGKEIFPKEKNNMKTTNKATATLNKLFLD